MQQLLDPVLLANRVDVGHLVVRQRGEVEVDLQSEAMSRQVRQRELYNVQPHRLTTLGEVCVIPTSAVLASGYISYTGSPRWSYYQCVSCTLLFHSSKNTAREIIFLHNYAHTLKNQNHFHENIQHIILINNFHDKKSNRLVPNKLIENFHDKIIK